MNGDRMEEERKCSICGKFLEDWEDDICEDCMNDLASAIIINEEMYPDEDDFA